MTSTPAPESAAPSMGAVSSADPQAQEAGMAMLRESGNAVDAAIATMLALTVVEPQSSGIGGGGFMLRGTADGTVESFDGREKAPAGAKSSWFLNDDGTLPSFDESVKSGLSVGVPGNVAMTAMAHAKHGKLPWAKLFEPAIKLARDGFKINPRLHGYLADMPDHAGMSTFGKDLFYDADGAAYPVGHVVKNETLAQTFEALASKGPEAFYKGPRAAEIVTTIASATPRDGAMTLDDFAAYQPKTRDAACGTYRLYRICSMGPPSSGGVAVLQILGMLERFDLTSMGADNPETWHLFVEAQRLAYADRELYMADSDFVSVPVAGLLDPTYLAGRSAMIDPDSTIADASAGIPAGVKITQADGDEPEEHGTSHLAAVDSSGTMVSYTSTIEGPFGSGLMAGGFYLNNELTDFSRNPTGKDGAPVANRVEGGKRPRSSMSPTVIWDPQGRPVLAIGAAGGGTIPVSTTRSIIGVIDFGLSAEQALGLPFIMAYGDQIIVEQGTWMETSIPQFKALGHSKISPRSAPIKGGAVKWTGTEWESARDPRIESGVEVP
ncbi:MAG: gamma-glutamyltransferase [Pontixanthobacter sp.]